MRALGQPVGLLAAEIFQHHGDLVGDRVDVVECAREVSLAEYRPGALSGDAGPHDEGLCWVPFAPYSMSEEPSGLSPPLSSFKLIAISSRQRAERADDQGLPTHSRHVARSYSFAVDVESVALGARPAVRVLQTRSRSCRIRF